MNVIILNGASSSGKSSIAKELQDILTDNYLHIGIDTFIAMMPEHTNNLSVSDKPSDGFYWQTQLNHSGSVQRIKSGQYGAQVNDAYRSTIRHLAESGLNLIVDEIMNGVSEQALWSTTLKGINVIFVAVVCSDIELEKREKLRNDRIEGSALEQSHRVHEGMQYGLEVDTTSNSAQHCAQQIASHIAKCLR